MKNWIFALLVSAAIVGCGSSVKLDDVPVEDKSGTAVGMAGRDATAASGTGNATTGQSGVKPVDIGGANSVAGGPAGSRLIYFDFDSYSIKPEFQSVIEAQAKYVRADKGRKMSIEGHTDDKGGREYNLALGQKRAEAVRQALGLLGVAESQIEAVSFGKEKPAVEGTDESAMAKNRRAEIVYK